METTTHTQTHEKSIDSSCGQLLIAALSLTQFHLLLAQIEAKKVHKSGQLILCVCVCESEILSLQSHHLQVADIFQLVSPL